MKKSKIQKIIKKLYNKRLEMLFGKGVMEGKITGFDEEIYEKMDGTVIACLPVSLHIKYSKYLFPHGTCYDRSLYMFLALDDAVLVRGKNKDLEVNYGKGHGGHGWVEVGNYVYDPSLMLRFDKDLYYKIYGCTAVKKIDKATYLAEHKDFVNQHVSTDFDEFKPGGKRRTELGILITQVKALSQFINDENFTRELNEYLSYIEYDEKQIQEERNKSLEKLFEKHNFRNISG